MQRYFVLKHGDALLLPPEEEHHFLVVMRGKKGDVIEGVYQGHVYTLETLTTEPLSFKILAEKGEDSSSLAHLSLAFSLLKHGNDDLVFEKATELGVEDFYPFCSERTIIRVEKSDLFKKQTRWEKIVQGAAEQCKRTTIPQVHPLLSLNQVLALSFPHKLFAYEEKKDALGSFEKSLSSVLPGENVLIVIGPEGGFSPKEAEKAELSGCTPIGLGPRILRAESASIYAASVFSYVMEGKR